jgi:hypothetical protein
VDNIQKQLEEAEENEQKQKARLAELQQELDQTIKRIEVA